METENIGKYLAQSIANNPQNEPIDENNEFIIQAAKYICEKLNIEPIEIKFNYMKRSEVEQELSELVNKLEVSSDDEEKINHLLEYKDLLISGIKADSFARFTAESEGKNGEKIPANIELMVENITNSLNKITFLHTLIHEHQHAQDTITDTIEPNIYGEYLGVFQQLRWYADKNEMTADKSAFEMIKDLVKTQTNELSDEQKESLSQQFDLYQNKTKAEVFLHKMFSLLRPIFTATAYSKRMKNYREIIKLQEQMINRAYASLAEVEELQKHLTTKNNAATEDKTTTE